VVYLQQKKKMVNACEKKQRFSHVSVREPILKMSLSITLIIADSDSDRL